MFHAMCVMAMRVDLYYNILCTVCLTICFGPPGFVIRDASDLQPGRGPDRRPRAIPAITKFWKRSPQVQRVSSKQIYYSTLR